MGQGQVSAPRQTEFDSKFASSSFEIPDQVPEDGKCLIESIYGKDSETAVGIEKVVQQIEQYNTTDAASQAMPKKLSQAAAALLRSERRKEEVLTQKADAEATAWLRRQKKPSPPPKPPVEDVAPPPPILALYTGRVSDRTSKTISAASVPVPEFYMLLGVDVDATFEDIKKGYRKEALQWHPDKNRHRLEEATERFKRINEAFDTLFDPEKRTAYDSGKLACQGKLNKLQGHGWAEFSDEDDTTLTPYGLKLKKQAWRSYIMWYGRIDDNPDQLVLDDNDPRAPQEKIKLFWRGIGEYAYLEWEQGGERWMQDFIIKVWKDTPTRWPKAAELQSMGESAQQEWKERRMVYNRRKHKVRLHIKLHEDYLDIPGRERKEIERIQKFRSSYAQSQGASGVAFKIGFKNVS